MFLVLMFKISKMIFFNFCKMFKAVKKIFIETNTEYRNLIQDPRDLKGVKFYNK